MTTTEKKQLVERVTRLFEDTATSLSYETTLVMTELTEVIYQLMEFNGTSKANLAREIGVSTAYITKMLKGDTNFTIATLVKLARALNRKLDVETLFVPRAANAVATTFTENWTNSSIHTNPEMTTVYAATELNIDNDEFSNQDPETEPYEYRIAA